MMLLIGQGTLCVMDVADAAIRSGGNCLAFFSRLNLVAWTRLLTLVLNEVLRRVGIAKDNLDETVVALKQAKLALQEYRAELEKIDANKFDEDTSAFQCLEADLSGLSEEEFNAVIIFTLESLGINCPWDGDFDEFMSDSNNKLVFQ